MNQEQADALFISYATEDAAAAEWLTLKLTSEGYRVWCDRYRLLGGESYPTDIDDAIKTKTFRLLSLISKHSLRKPNPLKERTLALNLGAERKQEFLIPLNLDGTKPTDLPWNLTDITYIPFTSWSVGLAGLLKKLRAVDAPRPLADNGRRAAIAALRALTVTAEEPETLYTNWFSFTSLPEDLYITTNDSTDRDAAEHVNPPSHPLANNRTVYLYEPRPSGASGSESIKWRDNREIDKTPTADIMTNLLRQSVTRHLTGKGLKIEPSTQTTYFPSGLIPKNQIRFRTYSGRETRVDVVGSRQRQGRLYRYHLAPDFRIRRHGASEFVAELHIRLYLTDTNGRLLPPRRRVASRKQIARSWWNHHWFSRQLAIMSFIADRQPLIRLGGSDAPATLSATALHYQIPRRIDEKRIPSHVEFTMTTSLNEATEPVK
jgi:hypothetical protein